MERHFEKRVCASLNFILICQDFASPSALRLYLESQACTVVQQDDTLVGIGSTTLPAPPQEVLNGNNSVATYSEPSKVDIHAYMRLPATWRTGLPAGLGAQDGRTPSYPSLANQAVDGREDKLCVAFVRALAADDAFAPTRYRFFEEALAHIHGAYMRHELHATATSTSAIHEEPKPHKESFYLTSREHQILKWVSEGKGCWETGAILGISERTVKFHLQNIYRKLNVVNRAQAITKAMRYALI